MIKKILFAFAMLGSFYSKSQVATQSMSDYIPESASVTDVSVWNPNFKDAFVFVMSHGLTVFNQKTDITLIDSKTFAEKKKIEYPKYKGFDQFSVRTHQSISYWTAKLAELNQNLAVFYKSKPNKNTAISAIKLNESLTVPEKPEYLFSVEDEYNVLLSVNDKKDICVFSNESKNKKAGTSTFYYRTYNTDLKLLKSDSLTSNYKTPDTLNALAYENGCALINSNGFKRSVTLTDVKNNKVSKFDLPNSGSKFLTVEKVKAISNDKIVLFGKYYSMPAKKKVKNGMFKFIYNLKTNAIEEQIMFDHVPTGKGEEEDQDKYVERTIITETGACYALISQNKSAWDRSMSYTIAYTNKYELIYLNSNTEKWKKQLPITAGTSDKIELLTSNGYLFLSYLDYEGDNNKINFNAYVFGDPTPSNPVTLRQTYKSNVSILKINTSGNIQQQSFVDVFYKNIMKFNNEFIAINQGLNGQVTSKCKFLKTTVNDK